MTKLVATAAYLSLTMPGAIAYPERGEIELAQLSTRHLFRVTPENFNFDFEREEEPASLDDKLYQFADELRGKLGIKEGEIDDSTESFLLKNKLFFLLFGLLFCWIAFKSLSRKN